jgi:hypothetical protein
VRVPEEQVAGLGLFAVGVVDGRPRHDLGGVGLVVVGGGEAAVDVLAHFALGGDLLLGQDGLLGVLG